jgi:HEAT repeat protein
MEILSPTLMQMALNIAIVLGIFCLAQIVIIVAIRWSAEINEQRTAEFRHRTEPEVRGYLENRRGLRVAVEALLRDPARALDLLMEMSARVDPDDRQPLRALFAALPLRSRELAGLQSHQWTRRLQAAERLGYLGDGVVVASLRDALHDPVLDVRFAAALSLAAHGNSSAVPEVVLAFDIPGEMNQRRVADTLFAFGTGAIPQLLEVLDNRDALYSVNGVEVAARALGQLRAQEAVSPLIQLLTHPEFRVRLNAIRALGQIGDPAATDAVARCAQDPAWEVRNAVMRTLGQLRATKCVSDIAEALRDESWWVRFSAAEALWQLGQPGREALSTTHKLSSDRFARDISRQILEEHSALNAPTLQTT